MLSSVSYLLARSVHLNLRTLSLEFMVSGMEGMELRLGPGPEELCEALAEALGAQESLGDLV